MTREDRAKFIADVFDAHINVMSSPEKLTQFREGCLLAAEAKNAREKMATAITETRLIGRDHGTLFSLTCLAAYSFWWGFVAGRMFAEYDSRAQLAPKEGEE